VFIHFTSRYLLLAIKALPSYYRMYCMYNDMEGISFAVRRCESTVRSWDPVLVRRLLKERNH